MDCCKAGHLIMKYMDKAISQDEAHDLHSHISSCLSCRQEFAVYDEIISMFTDMKLVKAPENFEKNVMEQVRQLAPLSHKAANTLDNLWCAVWGLFSILLGLGTLLALNRDVILLYMSQNSVLSLFVSALEGLSNDITTFAGNISVEFYSLVSSLTVYLVPTRVILAVVLAVLVTVQFFIYKKDKVRV